MIICEGLDLLDNHLQVARSSKWSFAQGQILQMIICKGPDLLDNHLQVARSSGWSLKRGKILLMIICKRPVPPDVHLKEARSSGWSFARGQILRRIICTGVYILPFISIFNLRCFSKDTLKENKKTNPVRNWGGPRENISRRRGWSDKSWGSPKAVEV